MLEFVLLFEGEEVGWVDPVDSFQETERHWKVDNGYSEYMFEKREGYDYIIRPIQG